MFNTKDLNELQTQIHNIAEPFQNKHINKHLIYLLFDHVLAKILPELLADTNESKLWTANPFIHRINMYIII